MRKLLIYCILIFLKYHQALSQTGFGLQQEFGFVWAHRGGLHHLVTAHLVKTQLDVMPKWMQLQAVSEAYPNSLTGISVGWLDYRNPTLGYMVPVTGFFENRFGGPKIYFNYRIAAGFSIGNRKFILENNVANSAISSNVNMAAQATLALNYKFTSEWQAKTGLSLQHYSNGSIRQPNMGLNLPTAILSITYLPEWKKPEQPKPIPSTKKWMIQSGAGLGFKRMAYQPQTLYSLWFFHGWLGYRQGQKSTWWFGIDAVRNSSLVQHKINFKEYANRNSIWQTAMVAGHEWHVGKASLLTQLGYTLTNAFPLVEERLFQRYGVRFKVYKSYQAGLLLKAYRGRADSFEWHMAYSF